MNNWQFNTISHYGQLVYNSVTLCQNIRRYNTMSKPDQCITVKHYVTLYPIYYRNHTMSHYIQFIIETTLCRS